MTPPFTVATGEARLRWAQLAKSAPNPQLPALLLRDSTSMVSLARNALFHGLAVLGVQPAQKVLVPAYHCSAIVDALLAFGVLVEFYRVGADCLPDLDDIEARVDQNTRALLAVHYFGFPAPLVDLRALCTAKDLFLIEDCAHVLPGAGAGDMLGSQGDISVFSFRKFLPVYDGGCLLVNRGMAGGRAPKLESEGWVFSAKVAKNMLEMIASAPGLGLAREALALLNTAQSIARGALWSRTRPGAGSTVPDHQAPASTFDVDLAGLPMSRLSRRVLHNADLAAITYQRRANYLHLLAATTNLAGLKPLHPTLPEGVCPWVFPVFSSSVTELHKRLRALGVAAAAWDGVVHPSLHAGSFPDAEHLYARLTFLPVHQDLTSGDLDAMVDVLKDLLEPARRPDPETAARPR